MKPDFFEDEKLATELTRDERLFYIGLWTLADDTGRFRAHAVRLRGVLFPYDDDLSGAQVEAWLMNLASTGRIVLYEADGERYAFLTKFEKHQRINRPSPPRHPDPEKGELIEPSCTDTGDLTDDSVSPQRGKGRGRGKGKGSSVSKETGKLRIGFREAVPVLAEHFWLGSEVPRIKSDDPQDPNERRKVEASVFQQLSEEFDPGEVIGILPLAREEGVLPTTGPASLRYLNSRRDLVRELIHELRKRNGAEAIEGAEPLLDLEEAMP